MRSSRVEARRLAILDELRLLDGTSEAHLDAVCRTACALFGVPIALVNLAGAETYTHKARCGLTGEATLPRAGAFCERTILGPPGSVLVVPDLMSDPEFATSPLVSGAPHARFYAGVPLTLSDGVALGTLCLIDRVPRDDFDAAAVERLRDLGTVVEAHLRLAAAQHARDVARAERHRAEARLVAKAADLKLVVSAQRMSEAVAQIGYWRINPETRFVTWSEGVARIFGRDMPAGGAIPLDTHLGYYHPEDRARVEARILAALDGQDPEASTYQGRRRIVRPDGRLCHVIVQGAAERDADGRLLALYGLVLDISDLTASETRLRDKDRCLRATLENMDQGLVMFDAGGRVRLFNRRARRLLDLPDTVLHEEARVPRILAYQARRGDFSALSVPPRLRDGTGRWLPLSFDWLRPDGATLEVRAVTLPDGGAVHTFTDVTEHRAAEARTQAGERQYRLMTDSVSDMIVRRGIDDVRTYVSPASLDLLGYAPEEMLAMPLGASLHPEDRAATMAMMEALRAGRIDQDRVTHRLRHRDGHWVWVEARARLVRDAAGQPVETITAVRDVGERMAAEEALRMGESRYRALADSLPQLVWVMSLRDGEATYVNQRFENYYGSIGPSRAARLARNHPDDAERMEHVFSEAARRGAPYEIEGRLRRHDGVHRWHKLVMLPILEAGRAVGMLGTALDIDDLVAARETLEETTNLLRLAQESAGAGLWSWDLKAGTVRHSVDSARMYGLPVAADRPSDAQVEVGVAEWDSRIDPADLATLYGHVYRALATGATYNGEFRLLAPAGQSPRWLQSFARVVFEPETNEPLKIVGLTMDVTERKVAEGRIAHMALHDGLTGLPNRLLFKDRLNHEIARAERHPCRFAVLACDLDRFKAVNDSLGHPAGDALLRVVTERLLGVVREGDTVARLGGDEFAVILAGLDDPGDASRAARRIIEALEQPVDLDGHRVGIGVSVGIGIGSRDGRDADTLFRNADLALYRAKADGRNTYRFYEAGMDALATQRNLLELEMREAVRLGDFALHYQPILNLATGTVQGFEALLRWHHPTRGTIAPGAFIPLAEETGLIGPLGTWALRKACIEAVSWPGDLCIAVNVSAVQFAQAGLEHGVVTALAASGLPAWRLELEITESVLMQDAEAVIACLHRLRVLGVRIALDDFGTGYSSLSYLRRFPFDRIKIDRSFIREIADPDTAAIVR
ncbi:EAL domain-containing protein, partial [Methylobacterium sp. J-068]|uniref:EAL domain-containing protein n=1 Tax=Methylobacterium sp. J-068 TaxID=2836649 RepID=UPI001FBB2656